MITVKTLNQETRSKVVAPSLALLKKVVTRGLARERQLLLGWTSEICWDGPSECIGMDLENVLG
eukprot:2640243-Karenia_brevis.AAC.1